MSGPLGSLPGFYYDPDRKKYFPGAAPTPNTPEIPQQQLGIRAEQVEAGSSRLAQPLKARVIGRGRAQAQAMQSTSRRVARMDVRQSATLSARYAVGDPTVTALASTDTLLLVGSNSGHLGALQRGRGQCYEQDTLLSSSIIDIAVEGDIILACTFGPQPLQLVRSLAHLEQEQIAGSHIRWRNSHTAPRNIRRFSGKGRDDVWCMALKGGAATFGGNGWVAHGHISEDFRFSSKYDESTPGKSDVLSMTAVDQHNVYIGQRSGQIVHYDFRVPTRSVLMQRQTPVTNLEKIESVVGGLIVAGLKDELAIYDIRFATDPVSNLQGHRNKYLLNLALTTTVDSEVILAAGADSRIRAWSAITGEQLEETAGGPLATTFSSPVRAMKWSGDDLMVGNGGVVDVFSTNASSDWKWKIH